MPRFRISVALIATAVILALGLRDGVRLARPSDRLRPCSEVLAPLQEAPIPTGATAAVLAGAQWRRDNGCEPLPEAIFRRPDVHWHLAADASGVPGSRFLVTVYTVPPPPSDWHPVWRRGEVTVLRSAR